MIVLPLVALDVGSWSRARFGAWEIVLALSCAAACLGFAYGLNAIAERRTDVCPRKNPLVGRPGDVPSAILRVGAASGLALLLAALLSSTALVAAGTSLVAGTLYSIGARAKAKPLVGLLFNGLIFVPLCFVLYDGAHVPQTFGCEVAIFVALLTQNQLLHELADRHEDHRAQATTTAQLLGETGTRWVAASFGVVVFGAAWLLQAPRLGLITAALLGAATVLLCSRRDLAPSTARVLHRRLAVLGGAVLYFIGHT